MARLQSFARNGGHGPLDVQYSEQLDKILAEPGVMEALKAALLRAGLTDVVV